MTIAEGTMLWEPPASLRDASTLTRYMAWLHTTRGLKFADYDALWRWSTSEVEAFWESIAQFFDTRFSAPYSAVLQERTMPGARWFAGARLNYAERLFQSEQPGQQAIIYRTEDVPLATVSWAELRLQVAAAATGLRQLGVGPGDRVVAYIPNIPEAVVAFLASAAIGAVWSSCSPDFGSPSVIDRFQQIAPSVLLAVDGYRYGGKAFDRREAVEALRQALPTLRQTVVIPTLAPERGAEGVAGAITWGELLRHEAELRFEQVPFDAPLWVLYSSGTTGLPKPIVQGHGGILLEHLKATALHLDLGPGDRFFWYTTTGWMMWNFLVGGLLVGSTILLFDGSPAYPDMGAVWRFAEASGMTFLGTSAAYITACMKADLQPAQEFDLAALRGVGFTGSPLPPEGFQWIYERVGSLWLASISGGTDVCTAFVGGSPLLPVRAGEIQCRCLGARVEAFDEAGQPLIGAMGELVLTAPMPSMPLYFWGDEGMRRYRASYFDQYPGIWRHGDWVKITAQGGVVIYGRSDSTINRQGIRMGSAEIYRAVEALPQVLDSVVIDFEGLGGASFMALFVVLAAGHTLDDALRAMIARQIRATLTPRHVPDEVFVVPEVPRTLNGKKLEVPLKKILLGTPPAQAASLDSLSNPQSLAPFVALASRFQITKEETP